MGMMTQVGMGQPDKGRFQIMPMKKPGVNDRPRGVEAYKENTMVMPKLPPKQPIKQPAMPASTSGAGTVLPTTASLPTRQVGTVRAGSTGMAPRARQGAAAQASGEGDFRRYEDEAYKNVSERYLNPQWERGQKDFDQRMIDRGLDIGTEAYNTASGNFARDKNDAYSKAAFDAMGYGLGAQGQAFGQSATNAAMRNQMGLANLQAGTSRDQLAAMMNQGNLDREFRADQFNESNQLSRDSLMAQLEEANKNRNVGSQQFNMGYDLSELGTLANIDQSYADRDFRDASFNAQRDDTAYNRLASMLSGLPQQGTPQIDTMGAYGLNQNTANQQYNQQNQAAAGNRAGLGNLLGAGMFALSDRRLKKNIIKVGRIGQFNVYDYQYKWGGKIQRGFMADEVIQIIPEAIIKTASGYNAIDYDMALRVA